MDVREKLVELMDDSSVIFQPETVEYLADHLIANGVTFAKDINVPSKWISVKDRLPEENGYYLCVVCVSAVNQRKDYRRMILFWEDNVWIDMANCFRTKKPLYWMPMAEMPQPPKGECL